VFWLHRIQKRQVRPDPDPREITDISKELLLQIKGLAEGTGFEVLHGIVDCLWVIGEPISVFKEAVERETRILTEVDSYELDRLPAHERWHGSLQLPFWQAEYWQDEDPGRDGPQRGHPRVRKRNATGSLRGPSRGLGGAGSH
jgi:hypothetical protein